MKTDQKLSFITLWRLNDWGMYNRRNEALLWELTRRDAIESVLHVEHITLIGLVYRMRQWIKAKDKLLRSVYGAHIKKGFSLKPVPVRSGGKYYIYSVVILYSRNNILFKRISDFFVNIQYHAINKYFSRSKENIVLVAYPPSKYLPIAIKAIKHNLLIADIVDDEAERKTDENRKNQILENYKKILPQCRWIFSTSPLINHKYKDYAGQEIAFLPNGVDINNFQANSHKKLFEKNNRKVVGYIGIINKEIDIALFEYILAYYPQVDFVLIGFATNERLIDLNKLSVQYSNFRYLGERNYMDIPGYTSVFDVLINIKKNDHTTSGEDSMKIYEYLATGKPIVSTPVPPAYRFKDLIYVAPDKYQFAEFLKKALEENDEDLRKRRIMAAMDNSWAKRVDVILEKVGDLLRDT